MPLIGDAWKQLMLECGMPVDYNAGALSLVQY